MSIANYGELQTAVANWLAKSNLTSVIPDFINLAATRIYYGSSDPAMRSDPVRVPEMMSRETPTLSDGTFSLPTRYIETIRMRIADGNVYGTLDYISPTSFAEYEDRTDYAGVYTILNGQVHFRGTSGTIVHDYYARFADFSESTDTNALLTSFPGIWLWGSVLEGELYNRDDAGASRAFRLYSSAVMSANRAMNRSVMSSMVMRVR